MSDELPITMTQISLLLHDIRSVHNVGSILRTADAAGVSRVYLSGYTPIPIDRFGRKRRDMQKVSLGAEDSVPWEFVEDPLNLIEKMQREGYEVVCLEQRKGSTDHREFHCTRRTLLVVGTETTGVSENLIEASNRVIEIKQYGKKESLNVSVALGIALFQLRSQQSP
ncbi:MAG: RNA methyltransferase [Candidatus Vogelbacteria bacterium CG10_big_fil_rev_8_21_14_0_10_45_14]|uniref:RNA methyltransferase n=1 Tax=Candidatus Vogelbacteria bacterium CG10_big_fil_rev_8_21_14_0_10_45_14 TaxID=1975042 RepID=A0A2H0RKD8_9BACT|nr:MAG: RNA methyltransferase [Candidatus Vogelbacteria bacterium CG10_big_fil_rev_8_21_14_0_10_45_14]